MVYMANYVPSYKVVRRKPLFEDLKLAIFALAQ
jgi:hypothetical protein